VQTAPTWRPRDVRKLARRHLSLSLFFLLFFSFIFEQTDAYFDAITLRCNAIFSTDDILLFYYFFKQLRAWRLYLELCVFMHFLLVFFLTIVYVINFFMIQLYQTTYGCYWILIISIWILLSEQVSSLSLKHVNPCRMFINYGRAQYISICRLLFYIMSRVVVKLIWSA